MSGAVPLGALVGRLVYLDVACTRCDRRGHLALTRLVSEHGAAFPLPSLLRVLAADCPRLCAHSIYDLCGAHYPGLAKVPR